MYILIAKDLLISDCMQVYIFGGKGMVGICTVSKDGKLLEIKEVSYLYRYFDYSWEETSKDKILK